MRVKSARFTHSPPRQALLAASVACALATGIASHEAQARITLFMPQPATPAFGGYSYPHVGPYERIVGTAQGELDPHDPQNAVIVDLALAPRNAHGKVDYSFNFYILKPVDLSRGIHRAMYEPPNRGRKLFGSFAKLGGGNDPATSTAPEDGFLPQLGYTMVWSGWDASAAPSADGLNAVIALPVAHNPNGSTITGPSFEYLVSGGAASSFPITYPPASTDTAQATLTHRVHLDDLPVPIAASGWQYNPDGLSISLTPAGTKFVANDIYELSYTAKDPTVNGIGFAAIRDFNSFLRYAAKDDAGTPNPLRGDVQRIYTYTLSQPGRLLNDFTHLGFNEDENGRQVFDGMLQWIAAGDGINMNLRFSQPGRTERNRQDHLFAEGVFPFANVSTHDKVTGKTDSRYARCQQSHTCPLAMEIYSANEYWVKAASLLHTAPDGKTDLPDSPYARNYFISSHQHGVGNGTSKGACQQLGNPLDSAPIQRALWINLELWSTFHLPPPSSEVPTLHDHQLATPDQASVGFPHIPGVTYTGLKTTRYRYDYGPRFDQGIMDIMPPVHFAPYQENPANGPIYPSFVPKTDSDGNDIAGIRLPAVQAPTATYTGWSLRAGPQANDGCEGSGQMIPFTATAADRIAAGDPRPSVKERYPTHDIYVNAVKRAVLNLELRRFLLPDDGQDYVDAAQASTIGN